jgi:hypothetical protein
MVAAFFSSDHLVSIGIAFVAAGAVFSVAALVENWKAINPLGVSFVALGSVMALGPQFEENSSGFSSYWIVVSIIAAGALLFALSAAIASVIPTLRSRLPFLSHLVVSDQDDDRGNADQQDGSQGQGPIRIDIKLERHAPNMPSRSGREAGFMLMVTFAAGALLGGLVRRK